MDDYGWLKIRMLKALIKQWEEKGLTDESIVLVYSDKHREASGMLGICCVETDDGHVALMVAPATAHDEIESGAPIKNGDCRRAPLVSPGRTRRPPDA